MSLDILLREKQVLLDAIKLGEEQLSSVDSSREKLTIAMADARQTLVGVEKQIAELNNEHS